MNELALFAGAGGGILGGKLLGWRTVCAVEIEEEPRRVLAQRQNDGILDPFPIWDDVRTFEGGPWKGIVDVISCGFPCQDISAAGKGEGIKGSESGLWVEARRIIREVCPRLVYLENSPMLTHRGMGQVLGNLAALGYDAGWGVLGANKLGAWHTRERMWIVAYSIRDKQPRKEPCMREVGRMGREFKPLAWNGNWKDKIANFRGMDDGMAGNLDRTDAIRNGQVPAVAATAWRLLTARAGLTT